MSILINMEMPKSCAKCDFRIGRFCPFLSKLADNVEQFAEDGQHHPNCPLIELPPHGRLIDADALMHEFEKAQRTMEQHGQEYSCSFMSSSQELSTEWYCVEDMLENAPTIIPAEEGE